jgi:nucleoside-diphosphate-sugar epimerase
MNILITGAFGFVGSNLSKTLIASQHHHLIAVDIAEPKNHTYNEYHSWNELGDLDWSKVDAIIHLAGKAHDTKNTTEEKTWFDINVGLTQQIFEYFLQSNASKFIFFSSVKAVADSVCGEYLTEEALPNPQTPYGKSKFEAEKYLTSRLPEYSNIRVGCHPERSEGSSEKTRYQQSWDSSQAQNDTKKLFILRPCMIHGPGNKGNLNLLFKLASKGIPWPLGAFENRRSYASIENLQFVIQQLVEKDIEAGTYQLADDEPLSTNQLIELIAESKGRKNRIWKINQKLIIFFARLGDILHLPLNSERLKKLTESYVVSNQKLKRALKIEKMPVSAVDGMNKTLNSF